MVKVKDTVTVTVTVTVMVTITVTAPVTVNVMATFTVIVIVTLIDSRILISFSMACHCQELAIPVLCGNICEEEHLRNYTLLEINAAQSFNVES